MTQVFRHAGVAESQSWKCVEFLAVAAGTISTHGDRLLLAGPDSMAQNQVWLAIGNGTPASGGSIPAAATMQALVKKPDGSALTADETTLATGLVNYFDEIEALADGADAITFAVNCGASSCKAAQLVVHNAAVTIPSVTALMTKGPSLDLAFPVTLGAASEIIKTGSTEIDLDTDKLVCVNGIVAGVFTVPESANVVLADGLPIMLRLWVKL